MSMHEAYGAPLTQGIDDLAKEAGSSAGADRLQVLLVEDDPTARDAVARWISESDGLELVGQFADPLIALRSIPNLSPRVALVDINLPNMSGIEFVAKAKQVSPDTLFVMLTVYCDTDHIFQALAAGACGYLLKATLKEQLLAAIRDAHEGGSPMTSDVARKVVQYFHRPPPSPKEEYSLSEREKAVLARLSAGFLYKEIAAEMGLSVTTVSTFVRRIYSKLQVRSRAQAVAKAVIRG